MSKCYAMGVRSCGTVDRDVETMFSLCILVIKQIMCLQLAEKYDKSVADGNVFNYVRVLCVI